ncbi:hypothetical protein JCM15457_1879 [Liquorilactobacillus sucicola DSM 21376 = JCM 15457]|uniref:HTH cro/C1-type domain-containing protein n=1 Tax=Liquorilactobacillus sucicola DSM 21376 = JCM 15457 TaxID=1423806 RepID=A0A023CZI3_9LACO|nr:helix-turn-helix transcriptional regulator [Liquorilactobacillus sucicola]KRN06659.1 hypothetical protein FD15_GL000212 [Liquorilactobacillus sucicola DSM 21376 = JCM 15457]GAJ26925.1 hypothetical protein JCM15457_1879 [Liquorilactobacillus sucicola DSM 21376 = JCM 15457]
MKIAEILKLNRHKRNWSQQRLAEELHISRQSISKWECGAAVPSFWDKNKVWLSIVCGLVLAIVFYAASSSMQIRRNTVEVWTELPKVALLIGLACSINWHKATAAFSRLSVCLLFILVALYLWPNIYDFISGYVSGYNNY